MINQSRGSAGLGALDLSARLSRRAHQHSLQMAQSNTLFHSVSVPGGENVGYAGSLQEVHGLLMNSPSHRANILGRFDRVGVGVVRGNGLVWVTEIFAR
jgi:uncharacterized protein YkwD